MTVAKEIVVLEEGRVVESGRFEDLRRRRGAVWRLVGDARQVQQEKEKNLNGQKGKKKKGNSKESMRDVGLGLSVGSVEERGQSWRTR